MLLLVHPVDFSAGAPNFFSNGGKFRYFSYFFNLDAKILKPLNFLSFFLARMWWGLNSCFGGLGGCGRLPSAKG
jgi:hypothetical protein